MLLTLAAFAVVLGVLIFVHEAGHFVAAKAVGVQVQRFSLGFGRALVSRRWGETEYRIAALPLGGYVKMAGLEEEGVMGELEGGKAEPPVDPARAFDRKPLAARFLVMIAGVTMNAVFAFLVYTVLSATVGEQRTTTTTVDSVMASALPPGAAALASLHRGDRIVAVGAESTAAWEDVETGLFFTPSPVAVRVAGRATPLVLDLGAPSSELRLKVLQGIELYVAPVVDSVETASPAARAGFRRGDRVLRANGDTVLSWTAFRHVLRASPGRTLAITVARGDSAVSLTLVPERRRDSTATDSTAQWYGYAGLAPVVPIVRLRFGPVAAVGEGWRTTVATLDEVVTGLTELVVGALPLSNLGGPIRIGQESGQAARGGIVAFLTFMAVISLNLAVLNLLPIPILDGGQLVFLIAEAVRRRPLSLNVRLRLSQAGLVVLAAIVILAITNDVLRLFHH